MRVGRTHYSPALGELNLRCAVAELPGRAIGADTTGHIRLSLLQPEDVMSEGCNRLERFLKTMSQADIS